MPIIISNRFIAALLRLGIVDHYTEAITIRAKVGEPVKLRIEKFGDDRILQLVEDLVLVAHREKRDE